MIKEENINWEKVSGLLPAIIQDADDNRVLMLGYMNHEALKNTLESDHVTFYSRTRKALWVKGETSGNYLNFVSAELDCDGDTLLVKAKPVGPVCHTGAQTCFNDNTAQSLEILNHLTKLIKQRNLDRPSGSYTTELFEKGPSGIAQKVGEEGVELSLAKVKEDEEEILNEAADLMFHMMVLLESSNLTIGEVCDVLTTRHQRSKPEG
ncbi:MAG: bifunctional phosphoribosyl-AMP cyclohydrolase/phosphoribosyl-ATP diphosphatase HisIE [Rhodobacteraceae bacterium]|nr:bifunctional phosphoribosyl-AMP cyclohydrolase/phosphoribosyl-ATP diphosphatase HisIE [Paracoccaceae bacterium]